MTTADHKVLDEGCESRDNHRFAVVVMEYIAPAPAVSYVAPAPAVHAAPAPVAAWQRPLGSNRLSILISSH